MPENIHSTADASSEDHALELNPADRGFSSARAGIFSLRRDRYFNATRLDETGHGVRRADIAEAAIAEATGEFQQAGGIRNHGDRNPRR